VTLLPEESKTIIVAHDWDEVLHRLNAITSPQVIQPGGQPTILSGWIKDDRFQLIVRQRRLNSFMPVAEGTIDPTNNGCLIFLRYRLMPFTRLYLMLWSIVALASGVCLTIYYHNIFVGLASLAIIALMHGVAWGNFKMHMRPLHDIIFKALE
jgi:hypothetical protein